MNDTEKRLEGAEDSADDGNFFEAFMVALPISLILWGLIGLFVFWLLK